MPKNKLENIKMETAMPLKQVFKAGIVLKRDSHAFSGLISLQGGGTSLFLGGLDPK